MPKRNLIWLLAVVAVAVVVWIARNPAPRGGGSGDGFGGVQSAYDLIRKQYLSKVDEDMLRRSAILGMMGTLDEYSTYFPPEKVDRLTHRVMGKEYGIGLEFEIVGGKVVVLGSHDGSPAHRAALVGGDVIQSINDQPLAGLDERKIGELLNPADGAVSMVIQRGDEQPRTVKLACKEYSVEIIEGLYRGADSKWVFTVDVGRSDGSDGAAGEKIVYVRIREFTEDASGRLQLTLKNFSDARGIILDLRGNPGGLLLPAIDVANCFIREGLIVTVAGREPPPKRYKAQPNGTFPPMPMVVLIDEGTASAAELLSGALQFHDRAVLVGTRTRGKGCVQKMITLPDNLGQINLTTSEFFVRPDRNITRRKDSDVWGIDPHEQVMLPAADHEKLNRLRIRGEVMPPMLSAGAESQPDIVAKFLAVDAQLNHAVELLKRPKEYNLILDRAAVQRERELEQHYQNRTREDE